MRRSDIVSFAGFGFVLVLRYHRYLDGQSWALVSLLALGFLPLACFLVEDFWRHWREKRQHARQERLFWAAWSADTTRKITLYRVEK